MAPGTRANPDRAELSETRIDEQDRGDSPLSSAEQYEEKESPPLNSELEENHQRIVSSRNGQSCNAESHVTLEKIEMALSKLAVAVTSMQVERSSQAPNAEVVVEGEDEVQSAASESIELLQGNEGHDETHLESRRTADFKDNRHRLCKRPSTFRNTSMADYELYPTHIAYKIYEKGMRSTRCKRIGDGSFFIAKRTWERLTRDLPRLRLE